MRLGFVCFFVGMAAVAGPLFPWDMTPVTYTPVFHQDDGLHHGETLDDVLGSLSDPDRVFISKPTYSIGAPVVPPVGTLANHAPGLLDVRLTRTAGLITGFALQNYTLNTLDSTNSFGHNGKAMDFLNANTILIAAEEGDSNVVATDSHGTVDRYDVNAPGFSSEIDLTNLRTDNGGGVVSQFDPEGIAVDRSGGPGNEIVYVASDDGPDQIISRFSGVGGGPAVLDWNAVVDVGETNGNDLIVLPGGIAALDGGGLLPAGAVAMLTGEAHVKYAYDSGGVPVVGDLFNGPIPGTAPGTVPQDLLIYDGNLYFGDQDGRIFGYDLSDLNLAPAVVDLGIANAIGGLGITSNGELLVSTRFYEVAVPGPIISGGSLLAFNFGAPVLVVVPEPGSLLLSSALLLLVGFGYRRMVSRRG